MLGTVFVMREDSDDFVDLFINDIPLMDVRAPVEFTRGAFPHTQNIPILDDEQRDEVGKRYKNAGQDEAIELGLKLATPEIRERRLKDWKSFVSQHPEGYLYCFRGGLRSRTTQAWLKQQGVDYPLIKGGYKAMRSYLIQQLEISVEQIPFVILSGLTGSGKTRVLKKTEYHIDLEGLANHRGSAFGRDVNDFQPTPVNWENTLSIDCLKYRHHNPDSSVLLEDEGRMIGRNIVPENFHQKMVHSPRIFLTRELEERVAIIRQDYISESWPLYQQQYGAQAEDVFSAFVLDNLARIKNRLGSERHKKIHGIFADALAHLFSTGESNLFDEGIRQLLVEYYDPMYQYQLSRKPVDVIFQGSEFDILDWVKNNMSNDINENSVSG
jgi:tRNA 2-selenouridine synthase